MAGADAANRFAPPRADVEDQAGDAGFMVDAARLSRFLAVLVDGLVPTVFIVFILVTVAMPVYDTWRQVHTPGIEPPRSMPHHLSTTWAWLAGFAMLGFFAWNVSLVHRFGQTFGKRVMNIRVVRTDGRRVPFSHFVLLRWLPLFVVGFVPVINVISSLLDPLLIFRESRQCLHDTIADTRVVTAESSVDATLDGDPKYAASGLRTINF